jgi:hypothetical protein
MRSRIALVLVLAACGPAGSYLDDWGMEELSTGKADGLLDDAPLLQLDEIGRGYVEGTQLDVFAIDLRGGSTVQITQSVTEGDLAPHFTLSLGGTYPLSSASLTRQPTRVVKTYELMSTGRHYIAVKPYQGEGAGRYELVATCVAGACAGDPPGAGPLDAAGATACVRNARACSFDRLPAFNGAVGPARSREIFETCLGADPGCADVCTDFAGGRDLCDAIIADLPFYADQDAGCYAVLESCMSDCYAIVGEEFVPDELELSAEARCWATGYNSTCEGYARGHVACGGSYADGSNDACLAHCEATTGVWIDDLELQCVEACD